MSTNTPWDMLLRVPRLPALAESLGLRQRRCVVCLAPFAPPRQKGDKATWLSALLCPECAHDVRPYEGQACPQCGLPSLVQHPCALPCGACLASPPPWETLTFYGLYEGKLKEHVLRFKYGEELTLAPVLGRMLAQACAPLLPAEVLIPMPRHEIRLRQRGFNQVHELARVAAALYDLPLNPLALTRTRLTTPQAGLPAKERRSNPQGSFAASQVQGKSVLLVDDIMTTGSTLRHAAEALLQAGAARVRVAVVSRAVFSAS